MVSADFYTTQKCIDCHLPYFWIVGSITYLVFSARSTAHRNDSVCFVSIVRIISFTRVDPADITCNPTYMPHCVKLTPHLQGILLGSQFGLPWSPSSAFSERYVKLKRSLIMNNEMQNLFPSICRSNVDDSKLFIVPPIPPTFSHPPSRQQRLPLLCSNHLQNISKQYILLRPQEQPVQKQAQRIRQFRPTRRT